MLHNARQKGILVMRYAFAFAAAMCSVAAPCWAAGEPIIAPHPDWVEAVPLPAPDPARAEAPSQALLVSSQARYGEDGHEFYSEMASIIQKPEGLSGAGTIALPWDPEVSDLIVHSVRLVRAGKTINLLGNGAKFTVLRRENNLEKAMLDGTLTAVLQPEGLSVGDTLVMSFTLRTRPGKLRLQPEHMLVLPPEMPIRRVFYREVWPASHDLRWKAGPALGTPKLRQSRFGTELVLQKDDAKAPRPPAQAPARFWFPAYLQISGYKDWSAVSQTLAPLYAAAAAVQPASPLQAEIERIAKASADPRTRALAALRLVQDQVRYVALGMGEGGYIPASAEQTWSRKFGDCKGKTVTLIALLNGLGIQAEPMLVSSRFGDMLAERLPQMSLFDHVVVRAVIDGRTYLLDGTRSGDRELDALISTPWGSGLPIRQAGAALETLAVGAPPAPLTEINTVYDASKGFTGTVPIKTEIVLRGDFATAYRLAAAQSDREELKKSVVEQFAGAMSEGKISKFDYRSDDARNLFTFTVEGAASMDWERAPTGQAIRFRFDNGVIAWDSKFERDGPGAADAPFAMEFPVYMTSRETVILPNGGAGFRIEGSSFERTVAGTLIARKLVLADGRAVADSSFRRLQPEISAAEAKAAKEGIALVNSDAAFIRSPDQYQASKGEIDALIAAKPSSATAYLERGYAQMQRGRNKQALADFKEAARLEPDNGRAFANQGVALVHLNKLDEAEQALNRSMELDPTDFVTHQGQGMLHAKRGEHERAIQAFTLALTLDADNVFTIGSRSASYASLGRFDLALADADRMFALDPRSVGALEARARYAVMLGDRERALAAIDAMQKLESDSPHVPGLRGELLRRLGRTEEARAAFEQGLAKVEKAGADMFPDDKMRRRAKLGYLDELGRHAEAVAELDALLAKQPDNPVLLTERCWLRAKAEAQLAKALADCNQALESQPDNSEALDGRGLIKLRRGDPEGALADFTEALKLVPEQAQSLYGRGLARLRKGDRNGGEADLQAARRLQFDIELNYRRYGLTPEAAPAQTAASAAK
jgi:tetratricopeptide (TPR) repeat protein